MELKIEAAKLTSESVAALIRFSKAATRYHSGKFHKKEYVSVGNERFLQERIIPRSVETDYLNAREVLLQSQDPEIRGILDQMDVTKMLDSLEGTSAKEHTDAHYRMIGLEKQLMQFASKLK